VSLTVASFRSLTFLYLDPHDSVWLLLIGRISTGNSHAQFPVRSPVRAPHHIATYSSTVHFRFFLTLDPLLRRQGADVCKACCMYLGGRFLFSQSVLVEGPHTKGKIPTVLAVRVASAWLTIRPLRGSAMLFRNTSRLLTNYEALHTTWQASLTLLWDCQFDIEDSFLWNYTYIDTGTSVI
jgi:hypothetical protein